MSARLELAIPNMSKWSSLKLCRLLSVTALAVKEETYYKARQTSISVEAVKCAEKKMAQTPEQTWRAMLQRVRTVRFDRRGTA